MDSVKRNAALDWIGRNWRGASTRQRRILVAAACISVGTAFVAYRFATEEARVTQRLAANLARGDYETASFDARALALRDPQNAAHRVSLARALVEINRDREALEAIRQAERLGAAASELDPLRLRALLGSAQFAEALAESARPDLAGVSPLERARTRGYALIGLRRSREAIAAFDEVMRIAPRDVSGLIGLATARARSGDAAGAGAMLDETLASAPNDPDVLLAVAAWRMKERDFVGSLPLLTQAAKVARETRAEEKELQANANLVDASLARGDLAGARRALERVVDIAPNSRATHLRTARVRIAAGDFASARIDLQVVLRHDPTHEEARFLLGLIGVQERQGATAESYLAPIARSGSPIAPAARRLLAESRLADGGTERLLLGLREESAQDDFAVLTMAGEASLAEGNASQAMELLERAYRANPADAATALRLARVQVEVGRWKDARELLKRTQAPAGLQPLRDRLWLAVLEKTAARAQWIEQARQLAARNRSDATSLITAARALTRAREFASARGLVRQAIALEEGSAQPWAELAAVEAAAGDLQAAADAYDRALGIDPHDVSVLLGKAVVAASRGDDEVAEGLLRHAGELDEKSLVAKTSLARFLMDHDRLVEARTVLRAAEAIAPRNLTLRQLVGRTELELGNPQVAEAEFRDLVRRAPARADYHVEHALALLALRREEDALRAVRLAQSAEPRHWPALVLDVQLSLRTGNPDGARAALRTLRQAAAPPAAVLTTEGDYALATNKPVEALKAYRRAWELGATRSLVIKEFLALQAIGKDDPREPFRRWLEAHPDDVPVRLALASSSEQAGDIASAIAEYSRVLGSDARHTGALNNLAWLRLERSELWAARVLAWRAHDLAPDDPQIADTYGWVLHRVGQHAEAVSTLRKAYTRRPQDEVIRFHLASALAANGDKREARRHLEALVDDGGRDRKVVAQAQELLATLL